MELPHELMHRQPRATEVEALTKIAPHLRAMKKGIYEALEAAGSRGITPDEYVVRSGKLINTVRRRFTDLWKEGIIRPAGVSRRNKAGNSTMVWVLGLDPEGVRAFRNKGGLVTVGELDDLKTILESFSGETVWERESKTLAKVIRFLEGKS